MRVGEWNPSSLYGFMKVRRNLWWCITRNKTLSQTKLLFSRSFHILLSKVIIMMCVIVNLCFFPSGHNIILSLLYSFYIQHTFQKKLCIVHSKLKTVIRYFNMIRKHIWNRDIHLLFFKIVSTSCEVSLLYKSTCVFLY